MMAGLPLAILFALAWIPLYIYRAESIPEALVYYAGAERRWVMLAPAIVAAHVTLGCILVSLSDPPPWRAACGAALCAAGGAFWFRARAQIGPLRVTRLPDEAPPTLCRDGAFGLVRNPLSFGYLVVAVAPVLVAARPVLLFTFAASFAALAIRAAQEERRLHAQLGATYGVYCSEVKRLIPFVW
jgi:protein-S-isoprenylcysteine O-methyltransferase Ste14